MTELFWDSEGGGYYTATSEDSSILIRMKEGEPWRVLYLYSCADTVVYSVLYVHVHHIIHLHGVLYMFIMCTLYSMCTLYTPLGACILGYK